MIKMLIEMDNNKISNTEYDVAEVDKMINDIVRQAGIIKKDKDGFLIGNGQNNDFANFGKIILNLKSKMWFLNCVNKWIWYVGDEVDDLATHYKQIANIS